MRGDRLLRLMLLLQARGKMTVEALRKELEVSERTVYRDLVALSEAGVPVVTERGPGGGCWLVEGYTTRLTGLTEEEARALFAAGVPAAFAALGMDSSLRGAFAKLAAALPARLRESERRARGRILVEFDASGFGEPLGPLRDAVLGSRRLRIVRGFSSGPLPGARLAQEVEALGLVADGRGWFLVARREGTVRAIAAEEILEVSDAGPAGRDCEDFDLEEFWAEEKRRRAAARSSFRARLRIARGAAILLRPRFGLEAERLVAAAGEPDDEGMVAIELGFVSLEEALLVLPGLGSAVEVLEPALLRVALEDRALSCAARNRPRH